MAIKFTSPEVAKNTTSKDLDTIQGCKLQEKSVEYAQNAEFVVLPDSGYAGMSKVNVSVDVVVPTVQDNKDITINQLGTIEILPDSDYDVMKKVTANIAVPIEVNKSVTYTENGTYSIIPSDGYDYIDAVNINVNVTDIPTAYDITSPYVSLAYYKGKTVPNEVVNWENLTNGQHKLSNSKITTFNENLTNLVDGNGLFDGCSDLTTVEVNLSKLEVYNSLFGNEIAWDDKLPNFTTLVLSGTLNCNNFNLSKNPALTVDSLMSVINALVDLTGKNSKTLQLGTKHLDKLTDEQKAVATDKNWILA